MSTLFKRQLAAVMFTDIEGYTALMQEDETAAGAARDRHRQAVQTIVPAAGGRVVQFLGDGSLSVFDSAVEAVGAAVQIQARLAAEPRVPLRVGLHLGDVAFDEEGVYGDAVNVAARIESLSYPGGILLSDQVYREFANKPQPRLVHVGRTRLKNVREPVDLYAVALEGQELPRLDFADEEEEDTLSAVGRAHLATAAGRSPYRTRTPGSLPDVVPLVGRTSELERIEGLFDRVESGEGSVVFVRGDRGVGKSRLAEHIATLAAKRAWIVRLGRGYPAEQLVPFAPFVDAFLPLLGKLSESDRSRLAGGSADVLHQIFPALGALEGDPSLRMAEPDELRTRVFWAFASVLSSLAAHHPTLVILDDLQWCDASSRELLRFCVRQCASERILFVCLYSEPDEDEARALRELELECADAGLSTTLHLTPLDRTRVRELVEDVFGARGSEVEDFCDRLFTWTRGNPFYVEGVLEGLVEQGRLELENGAWRGWEVDTVELPRSVRDAVMVRISRLGPDARVLVDRLAVLGARTVTTVLERVSGMTPEATESALQELRVRQVTRETDVAGEVAHDFVHPLIREVVRTDLSLSRLRALHGEIATSLEAHFGIAADEHAVELAYHFGRASATPHAEKAIRYLTLAGRRALDQRANREAVAYFADALERIDALGDPAARAEVEDTGALSTVVRGLARALARTGEYDASLRTWRRALAVATASGDERAVARVRRHMGLTQLWADRLDAAEEELRLGIQAARRSGDRALVARINLALAAALGYAGRSAEATQLAGESLEIAKALEHPGMEASAQFSLQQWTLWSGDLARSRSHGLRALELSEGGDPSLAFWSHWALAVAEGMFGDLEEARFRVRRSQEIADEVGSPILRLWAAEVTIEHAVFTGSWQEGVELGAWAIDLARRLNQKTLLPRLLVWTALIHLGRGETEVARAYVDEAWETSGADAAARGDPLDVHTVVPAHIGRASYLATVGRYDEAIRVASIGLDLADRSGNVVWGLHRLLPILSEAYLRMRRLDEARASIRRIRESSERIGHQLGKSWALAGEALLAWLEGDAERGARDLRAAADRLDEIPMIWDSARVRRQLAGRLAEIGDREGALHELRRVHRIYRDLGAALELQKTVEMFEELGAEPPSTPDPMAS